MERNERLEKIGHEIIDLLQKNNVSMLEAQIIIKSLLDTLQDVESELVNRILKKISKGV